MSDWLLAGLGVTLFIAGFNVGQDCKIQRGIFGRKKQYKYYMSCVYTAYKTIGHTSRIVNFNSEMTTKLLENFIQEEIGKLKEKFKTEDVAFGVINFKEIKD